MQKRLLAAFGKKVVADCLEKAKNICKKGVLYPLKKRLCSQQPLEKWQKCDTAFRKRAARTFGKKVASCSCNRVSLCKKGMDLEAHVILN